MGSSVGIVTRQGAGRDAIGHLAVTTDFVFFKNDHTGSAGKPAPYSVCSWRSFPEVTAAGA